MRYTNRRILYRVSSSTELIKLPVRCRRTSDCKWRQGPSAAVHPRHSPVSDRGRTAHDASILPRSPPTAWPNATRCPASCWRPPSKSRRRPRPPDVCAERASARRTTSRSVDHPRRRCCAANAPALATSQITSFSVVKVSRNVPERRSGPPNLSR